MTIKDNDTSTWNILQEHYEKEEIILNSKI